MPFKISSTSPCKGFFLCNQIEFNGGICAFIGKNGSGKTRLLDGISGGLITVNESEDKIFTREEIGFIDFRNPDIINFNHAGSEHLAENFAKSLLLTTNEIDKIDDLPENGPLGLSSNHEYMADVLFDVKAIFNRACSLFGKEFRDLHLKELMLSAILHNEFNLARYGSNIGPSINSLSQFTINYHQAFEINKYLAYLNSIGENHLALNENILKEKLGDRDPHKKFSELVEKLFRGKYIVTEPQINLATFSYIPQLKTKKNSQPIGTNDLSSGEKIIFWLCLRTFELSISTPHQMFKTQKLILLDEPDSHLHPQMIVDFFDCLNMLHESLGVSFIFTTHSPTTVALMPNANIFNLEHDSITNQFYAKLVNKDTAISQLLDGVTQISIDPENSRQIYVENSNDKFIYELIYSRIKARSDKISKNIVLSFINAAPIIHENELRKFILSVYKKEDEKVDLLVNKINGGGDCNQVKGMVSHLIKSGNKTIRGIVDWDCDDTDHGPNVIVLAKGYAYSIENLVYDPISLYAYLTSQLYKHPRDFFHCCDDYPWREAIHDLDKLQKIVDIITKDILERENKRDHVIKYMNGIEILGDKEYFIPTKGRNGHSLESDIKRKYGSIERINERSSGKPLMYFFMAKVTLALLGWEFINSKFEDLFSDIK